MAGQIADIIVPSRFTSYSQQLTTEKSRIVRSGAVVVDAALNAALAGGGKTFNEPSFRDLANDPDNVSTDNPASASTPNKITTSEEIQIRLSRNSSWSSMDLASALAGADSMQAIADRVSDYWVRRQQSAFVATMKGVFADNAAAPVGSEHVQNDMTFDVSGVAFAEGVTNFTTRAFIDAALTMGDSMEDLSMIFVHSIVYGQMRKNNLIEFVPDSINPQGAKVPEFQGHAVVVDDGMPFTGGVFESWLFGAGAVRLGLGSPRVPTEVDRLPAAGDGGGQEVLHNRVEWVIHPVGHAFVAAAPANGGPTNAATTNNLAHAASWMRVFPERKQIKIARLITREF